MKLPKLISQFSPSNHSIIFRRKNAAWILLAAISTMTACQSDNLTKQSSNNSSPTQTSSATPNPTINIPEVPLPPSGKVTQSTKQPRIAPLTIESSPGANYFLKLINISSQTTIMTVFIRGGSPAKVKVPIGNYEIRYASGNKWYGTKLLFGSDTTYNKAESVFDFKKEGNRIMGYTLKLYKVQNGNLRTTQLDQKQF
jgi:hypothetical protein